MHLFRDPQHTGCLRAQERLSEYVDNRLSARQAWEVERHLAACPACAQMARELRTTVALVRDLPRYDTGEDFMARLHARLDGVEPTGAQPRPMGLLAQRWRWLWPERLRMALRPASGLGIAAGVILTLWAMPHLLRENGNRSMSPVGTSAVTPEALHYSVALAASDPFEDPAAANLAAHAVLKSVQEESDAKKAH